MKNSTLALVVLACLATIGLGVFFRSWGFAPSTAVLLAVLYMEMRDRRRNA